MAFLLQTAIDIKKQHTSEMVAAATSGNEADELRSRSDSLANGDGTLTGTPGDRKRSISIAMNDRRRSLSTTHSSSYTAYDERRDSVASTTSQSGNTNYSVAAVARERELLEAGLPRCKEDVDALLLGAEGSSSPPATASSSSIDTLSPSSSTSTSSSSLGLDGPAPAPAVVVGAGAAPTIIMPTRSTKNGTTSSSTRRPSFASSSSSSSSSSSTRRPSISNSITASVNRQSFSGQVPHPSHPHPSTSGNNQDTTDAGQMNTQAGKGRKRGNSVTRRRSYSKTDNTQTAEAQTGSSNKNGNSGSGTSSGVNTNGKDNKVTPSSHHQHQRNDDHGETSHLTDDDDNRFGQPTSGEDEAEAILMRAFMAGLNTDDVNGDDHGGVGNEEEMKGINGAEAWEGEDEGEEDGDDVDEETANQALVLLLECIGKGDLNAASRLARLGAPVNGFDSAGVSPLCLAAELGNHNIAGMLITLGADPNIVCYLVCYRLVKVETFVSNMFMCILYTYIPDSDTSPYSPGPLSLYLFPHFLFFYLYLIIIEWAITTYACCCTWQSSPS